MFTIYSVLYTPIPPPLGALAMNVVTSRKFFSFFLFFLPIFLLISDVKFYYL